MAQGGDDGLAAPPKAPDLNDLEAMLASAGGAGAGPPPRLPDPSTPEPRAPDSKAQDPATAEKAGAGRKGGGRAAGGGGTVTLDNRFDIDTGSPLPELATPQAAAFAVTDRRSANRPAFALVAAPEVPVRMSALERYRLAQGPGVIVLLGHGVVDWTPDKRRCMALVYERPMGGRLTDRLDPRHGMGLEHDITRELIKPLVTGLQTLVTCGVTHRAIRPNNVFYMDKDSPQPVLGDFLAGPPGVLQPEGFEPLESAMALPTGRGPGHPADDMFAFGVTLLAAVTGRMPGERMDPRELMQARVQRGSFAAMAGDARLPLGLVELVRGLMLDDPGLRWSMESLESWLTGRRLTPAQGRPAARSKRVFRFNGVDHTIARELAESLARNWDKAAEPITDGRLEIWLRRGLDDKETADAVSDLVMQHKVAGSRGASTDVLIAKVCMRLDPAAPVRYKEARFTVDGVGSILAMNREAPTVLRAVTEALQREVIDYWFSVQTSFDPVHATLSSLMRDLRMYLQDTRLGYGVERCLYELDSSLPCQSPLIIDRYVVDPSALLPALEAVAGKADTKGSPVDRHVAAMIAARFSEDVYSQLTAMADTRPERAALGLLSLLSSLQWRFGPDHVPALASWVGSHLGPIISSYHSREKRRQLERDVPKLVRKGDLTELHQMVDDRAERERDARGFAMARTEYAAAENEIGMLEGASGQREEQAEKLGQQTAAMASVTIALITVFVLLALRSW